MSTATEISRLQTARNKIRNKMVNFGLGTSTDLLDDLADEIDGIANRGAVSATVQEGDTYTIPAGYHNGSGTVSGVSGGGNYQLQTKGPITPTKSLISVSPDNGYYGLAAVSIDPIPEAYQDVSSVTATAGDVLANKIIVVADGTVTAGTMTNNGAVNKTLDATTSNQSYTVPSGYHNGLGTVQIVLETKSATPTTSSQDITPTSGKVLSKVTVGAIPSQYHDTSNVDATAGDVLSGKVIVAANGTEITGSMTNNGAVSKVLDVSSPVSLSYTIPAGYHNGSGIVSIDPESKSVTPTTVSQDITATNGKVLGMVTVGAIPAEYGDTTGDDAVAGDILYGKKAHSNFSQEGSAVALTGSMTNNGTVTHTLDATTSNQSFTIAQGYHSGSGAVSIVLEEKSTTPTGSSQNITPTSGKVLSKVTVGAIPAKYGDTTGDDGVAANVLYGKKVHTIVNGAATQITGEMTNNGAITGTIDGLTTTSYTVPAGYHNGSGTVSLTNDIENALAAI